MIKIIIISIFIFRCMSCRRAPISISSWTKFVLQFVANKRRRRNTQSSHWIVGKLCTHWVRNFTSIHLSRVARNNMFSHRNPTPSSSKLPKWQPTSKFPLNYYRIGNQNEDKPFIAMETGLYEDRARFWREIGAHLPANVRQKDEL